MSEYTQYLQGKVINTGCEWTLQFRLASADFPEFPVSAKFHCQFRAEDVDGPVLADLTSVNGKIVRINGTTLQLILSGADTAGWTVAKAVADVIRTDLPEPQHLGFTLEIPVKRTITRN